MCGGASVELYGSHTKDKYICCEGEREMPGKSPVSGVKEPQKEEGASGSLSRGLSLTKAPGESFINSAYEFSMSGSAPLSRGPPLRNIVTMYSLSQD